MTDPLPRRRHSGGCEEFTFHPGKPYSHRWGRKPFAGRRAAGCEELHLRSHRILPSRAQTVAGKRRRRRCGFAPHSRLFLVRARHLGKNPGDYVWVAPHSRSLILPLRAQTFAGRVARMASLRPHPESLILPLGKQTFCLEKPSAIIGVTYSVKALFYRRRRKPIHGKRRRRGWCALHPGKPYSSVEGIGFCRKSCRRLCGFAPHSRESFILVRRKPFTERKKPGG